MGQARPSANKPSVQTLALHNYRAASGNQTICVNNAPRPASEPSVQPIHEQPASSERSLIATASRTSRHFHHLLPGVVIRDYQGRRPIKSTVSAGKSHSFQWAHKNPSQSIERENPDGCTKYIYNMVKDPHILEEQLGRGKYRHLTKGVDRE